MYLKKKKQSLNRDINPPPLSRTARLCPLFRSISNLYIPELWSDRSGGTVDEQETPTACQWTKKTKQKNQGLMPNTQKEGTSYAITTWASLLTEISDTSSSCRGCFTFSAQHTATGPELTGASSPTRQLVPGVIAYRKLHESSFLPSY